MWCVCVCACVRAYLKHGAVVCVGEGGGAVEPQNEVAARETRVPGALARLPRSQTPPLHLHLLGWQVKLPLMVEPVGGLQC